MALMTIEDATESITGSLGGIKNLKKYNPSGFDNIYKKIRKLISDGKITEQSIDNQHKVDTDEILAVIAVGNDPLQREW